MEDKGLNDKFKDLSSQLNETQEKMSTFVDDFMKDFTEEEKAMIDAEMNKFDMKPFSEQVSNIMNKLSADLSKMSK